MTSGKLIPIEQQIAAINREVGRRRLWLEQNPNAKPATLAKVERGIREMLAAVSTLSLVKGISVRSPSGAFIADGISLLREFQEEPEPEALEEWELEAPL